MNIQLFAATEAQVLAEPLINWGALAFPIALVLIILVFSREPKVKKPKKVNK